MDKKLIAIDLDGTTLNNESKLTPKTKLVLNQAEKAGHLVSIVTGRPYRLSKDIYAELGLTSPIVNFNGALCHNPTDKNSASEYHLPIDRSIAFEVMKLQNDLDIQLICAEVKDSVFAKGQMGLNSMFLPENSVVNQLTEASLKVDPTSICIFAKPEDLKLAENELANRCGDSFSARTWGGEIPCLEIVRPGVQKALGVEKIAHLYGFKNKDIIAMGDEDNDLEMIEYAGVGVAMQNAIPKIKEIANVITDRPNSEDGLAHFLENYLNLA